MSEKINISIDTDVMIQAVKEAFEAVMESNGTRPALVLIGHAGTVTFELGAYDIDRMEAESEPDGIYMEMSDPAIYEQLNLNFLH